MADETDQTGEERDGGDDPDDEPHDEPGSHAAMLHERGTGSGMADGSAAAAGEEVLDVPVVLQQEVELDHVVDAERGAGRHLAP